MNLNKTPATLKPAEKLSRVNKLLSAMVIYNKWRSRSVSMEDQWRPEDDSARRCRSQIKKPEWILHSGFRFRQADYFISVLRANYSNAVLMEVSSLISSVIDNPPIWDKRLKAHFSRDVVDKCWKHIAEQLGVEGKCNQIVNASVTSLQTLF